MFPRQAIEQASRNERQLDEHAAPIAAVREAPQQPPAHASVDQADGALVADLEKLRKLGDRRPALAESPDKEKQLVLARRNAGLPDRVFGETEETAQRLAPPSQAPIFRVGQPFLHTSFELPHSRQL